ncbi:hypothetical protein BO223_08225 [Faecalibaculum rodentium]|uniref:Uncharacterized protein n=1 Tax=Faecalibaculum rodentium TaxID=1702221 RepID=A0A1Q9YJB0_9FIRM|nr:hypothetical protein BO223_08225 [Faecalibaculum rodentium]
MTLVIDPKVALLKGVDPVQFCVFFFLCAGCPRPMNDNMDEWLPVTVPWILVSGSLHRLFDPEPGFTPVFPLVAQAYQSKH